MNPKKILLIRNDKLGDFVLALPAFALIKQSAPDWHVTLLAPEYTAPLARLCPFADEVLIDRPHDSAATLSAVRAARFDLAAAFLCNGRNAALLWRAGIAQRYAPATKLAQILFNRRLRQRRSRSERPEYVYNLELARYLLEQQGIVPQEVHPPYLSFPANDVSERRRQLSGSLHVCPQRPLVFVHAGSGGSANNLTLPQYAALVSALLRHSNAAVLLTAGPGEEAQTAQLLAQCSGASARLAVYSSDKGLPDFALSCAAASAFVAGSTGTLHLAAALNRPTVGFYPSVRTASPLRWQTVNDASRRLAFAAPADSPNDLSRLNMEEVWTRLWPFLQRQGIQAA